MLLLALVAMTISSLPVSSHAGPGRVSPPEAVQAGPASGPGLDGGGALYAMACGFGIRYWPALGWNFAWNVAMVGFCTLALMDALS